MALLNYLFHKKLDCFLSSSMKKLSKVCLRRVLYAFPFAVSCCHCLLSLVTSLLRYVAHLIAYQRLEIKHCGRPVGLSVCQWPWSVLMSFFICCNKLLDNEQTNPKMWLRQLRKFLLRFPNCYKGTGNSFGFWAGVQLFKSLGQYNNRNQAIMWFKHLDYQTLWCCPSVVYAAPCWLSSHSI